jgi:hypothetical protein
MNRSTFINWTLGAILVIVLFIGVVTGTNPESEWRNGNAFCGFQPSVTEAVHGEEIE